MVVHLVYFERTKNKHTGAGGGLSKDRRGANDGVFNGVVRAKGRLWVACANAYPIDFHAAGATISQT